MQPLRVLLSASLVLALVAEALAATPFAVNRTEILRLRTGYNHDRRRARSARHGPRLRRSADALETTDDQREDTSETFEILITLPTVSVHEILVLPTPATIVNPLQRDPPPNPPSSPYLANDTLVGMSLGCSDADKRCLDANRVVDPVTGLCYTLGDRFPCNNTAVWTVDKSALHEGRVQGRCYTPAECDRFLVRMAYDGRCYNMSYASSTLCGNHSVMSQHFFGDAECSSRYGAQKPRLAQPETAGGCVLPELRPQSTGAVALCDRRAVECGKRGWLVAPSGECAVPLSPGGCPAGEQVVLDADALRGGRLRARCAPLEPCPSGEFLLSGRCRSSALVRETLCFGETLFQMPTGEWECTRNERDSVLLDIQYRGDNYCEVITYILSTSQAVFTDVGIRHCPRDDAGNCITPIDIQAPHDYSIMDED